MKSRMLIYTLTIALVIMGGAYAKYWNQTFSANFTVETGQLSLETSAGTPYVSEYAKATIDQYDADNHSFSANIINFYPSAECVFTINVKNTSTLGVAISDISIEAVGNSKNKEIKRLLKEVEVEIALEGEAYQYIEAFIASHRDDLLDITAPDNQRAYKIKFTFDPDNSVELNELEDIDVEYQIVFNYEQLTKEQLTR